MHTGLRWPTGSLLAGPCGGSGPTSFLRPTESRRGTNQKLLCSLVRINRRGSKQLHVWQYRQIPGTSAGRYDAIYRLS